ncbi:hypothetical protein K432DRAFT_413395 [Lepidopterella palustris CBS 459.81]|uniref:Serine-rich protein n=1 Tax=Lepidopterella palustris CBS 459.81 TaxID=1314670 RepID=A0A8E2EJR6_9PEZI|nr:hypothetical protein K432DRAFT_413395 [Lepidopterella palustris CBS 459.81]
MSSNITQNPQARSQTPQTRSPKRSPQSSSNSSPRRRPLHERSNSQTNQYASPTIRIVEDPGAHIYSKTPFPSHPSQILPPRHAPGYVFDDRGLRVSDHNTVTNAVPKPEPIDTLVPKPLQPRKANRTSASTSTSDTETFVNASPFSPSSSRFSQGTTPPSSPALHNNERVGGLGILQEGLPPEKRLTIRAVIPSTSSEGHALTPRASAASLASSASSDTLTLSKHEDRRGPSSSNLPLPSSETHKRPPSAGSNKKKKRASSTNNKEPPKPILKKSLESLAFSDISNSSSERPRSRSNPTIHEARQISIESGVRVQFPIVRPPSASGLWAESRVLPKHPSRMNNSNRSSQAHQWSSQLSTIHSESERGSQSITEVSGPTTQPRRRQTIGSIASSEGANISSEPSDSSVSIPLPLFSPALRPSDGRDSDEHHDTISPLQSPPLRQQRSGYLNRHNSDPRPSSSRPGSSQSDFANFIASTIPAWARVYYRRGERTSIGAPESTTEASESVRVPTAQSGRTMTPSESNFPLSIYRPRNRPHQHLSQPATDSMVISDAPVEQEIYVVGPPRRNISEPYTPRLRQDRRSQARLSAWRAPSFDEPFGSLLFSRQNRQILLFCLGFVFPFAWMIAAFLPLPVAPGLSKEATPSQADIERAFVRDIGPIDERRYQKARWWRNLNRIMSVVGILLIGAIIALAVVASRM